MRNSMIGCFILILFIGIFYSCDGSAAPAPRLTITQQQIDAAYAADEAADFMFRRHLFHQEKDATYWDYWTHAHNQEREGLARGRCLELQGESLVDSYTHVRIIDMDIKGYETVEPKAIAAEVSCQDLVILHKGIEPFHMTDEDESEIKKDGPATP